MTLAQMKKKALALIEEIDEAHEAFTSDPDIEKKLNTVIQQIQMEVCRIKKVAAYTTEEIEADELFDLNLLDGFYQLRQLRFKNKDGEDCDYELIEHFVRVEEDGEASIIYYKFPEEITDETLDEYEFELTQDALEVMPYGIAADLLKSDVSTNYGEVYAKRYKEMLERLDPRYSANAMISIEGGLDF